MLALFLAGFPLTGACAGPAASRPAAVKGAHARRRSPRRKLVVHRKRKGAPARRKAPARKPRIVARDAGDLTALTPSACRFRSPVMGPGTRTSSVETLRLPPVPRARTRSRAPPPALPA